MKLQGYENFLDPFTGQTLSVERATGEVYETITATLPIGSICYTPEQQRAYRDRKEREEMQRLREEERRHRRNSTPKFFFLSAERQEHELHPATTARLIYLATFLDYTGKLKVNSHREMNRTDLESVLQLKKSEVYYFWNEVKNKYITEDRQGYLHMLSEFSCRGKLPYGKRYQQIYIDSVRQLYRRTKSTRHRHLGYVFQMIPFINIEYNILCHNPWAEDINEVEPFSIDEFCAAIGYKSANRSRLMKIYSEITFPVESKQEQFCVFVTKGSDIGRTKIFVNPHILYHGKQDIQTQILGKLCDFTV